MIAALNRPTGMRKCPQNGATCLSPRCQMGLCQRMSLKAPTIKKPLPLPGAKICPIDNQRCIEPGLCQVACTDVRGIAHLAFGPEGASTAPSRLNAPSRIIPQGGTIVTCPILKAPCLSPTCLNAGMCQAKQDDGLKKIVAARAANDPKVLTPVECPADPNGPLCDTVWCLTRGKCAIREEHSGTNSGTVMAATANRTDCHKGLYKLGKLGKASIWVGREAAVFRKCPEDQNLFSLVVCLIGGQRQEPSWLNEEASVVTGNQEAAKMMPAALFRRGATIPYMHINWPDYGVPNLDLAWWDSFAHCLEKIDGHVALFCMGGHGRTGTASSILATRAGWVKDGDCPVRWLRSVYCDNAVESESQAAYIESMCPGWFVQEDCGHYENIAGHYGMTFDHYSHGHGATRTKASNVVTITQGKGPPKRTDVNINIPTKLSKNRYKKHRKNEEKRLGRNLKSLGELDDGELVAVDGHVFMWQAADQKFQYMGIENPAPNADLPNDINLK